MVVIATLTMNLPLTQKADLLFEIIGHWGIECLCSIVFCVVQPSDIVQGVQQPGEYITGYSINQCSTKETWAGFDLSGAIKHGLKLSV